MRDPGKVPGKISDLMPALGNWSLSVFPAPLPRPPGTAPFRRRKRGRGSARPGAAERGSGGARGAAPGEGGRRGPPPEPGPGGPWRHPTSRADGRAGRRRPAALRARLPAPSAVMGAAPPAVLLPPSPSLPAPRTGERLGHRRCSAASRGPGAPRRSRTW